MTTTASRVQNIFERFHSDTIDACLQELAELYHPDIEFRDPVQHTRGRDAFLRANRRFVRMCKHITIVFHDRIETKASACLVWTLTMSFPLGRTCIMEGTSHLRFDADGAIVSHRDYWDGLGSFATMVPGASLVLDALVERFGSHKS